MSKKEKPPYPIPSSLQPSASVKTDLLPVTVPLTKIIPVQKIIRLSQTELAAKVEEALGENPFLERVNEEAAPEKTIDKTIDRTELSALAESPIHPNHRGLETDGNVLEEVNADRGLSLTGDLLQQLDWLEVSHRDRRIAEGIISLIGERGYVDPQEVEAVREEVGASKEDFDRVWGFLKTNLEPPGVTCEGIQDSLAVQLLRRGYEEDDLSVKIIRNFFPELSKKKYSAIGKALGVSTQKVKAAATVIHALDPYPLRNRDEGEFDNSVIVPDVVVRSREGRLEVGVNRETVPRIRLLKDVIADALNRRRGQDLGEGDEETSQEYLKKKKEEAETLINALGYRESNLKKVIDYLVERQEKFFIEGFSRLQPCRMGDVAHDLNIDKGTLSRLVNSKYVATDWGTFRLREMFSLPVEVNGKKVSPKIIQEKIKDLINEFPDHKLTDQKISVMLRGLGYPIARRTVNKYRKRIEQ